MGEEIGVKIQCQKEEIFEKIKLEKFERDGDCIYDPIRSFYWLLHQRSAFAKKQLYTYKGTWEYLLIGSL